MKEIQKKNRRVSPGNALSLLFFLTAVIAIVVAVLSIINTKNTLGYLVSNSRNRMESAANAAALLVTPAELDGFVTAQDVFQDGESGAYTAPYRALKDKMADFAAQNEVYFVYYYRVYAGETEYVGLLIDNDESDTAYTPVYVDPVLGNVPGQLAMEPSLLSCITDRATVVTGLGDYSEGFDGLLSAFAPVFDASGNVVYLAGVDIEDSQILDTRRSNNIFLIFLVLSLVLPSLAGIGALLAFRRRNHALAKRTAQQELMSALSRGFVSESDMSVLIVDALRRVRQFLGASRILIPIVESADDTARPHFAWNDGSDTPMSICADRVHDLAVDAFPDAPPAGNEAQTIHCGDCTAHPIYNAMAHLGVKAFVWAPLYVGGRYWSLLSVEQYDRPRAWTDADLQLIALAANIISASISRRRTEDDLKDAVTRAENASHAKGDFLANMSHEMRTPLNAVIGMTAIAKGSDDLSRKTYCLDKIEEASTHLLGVINDILDMSKIEANKLTLSYAEFDLEKMLQRVSDVITFRVGEKHQAFSVNIDPALPPVVEGDDQRLAQVIANFLSNAVKFTPDGGNITLSAVLEKETEDGVCTVRFEVKDSGIGIAQEQQARLFHSFEQADSSISRKFGGTGLGLAISKRIVEMMGGSIWVQSVLGEGSTFGCTVPVRRGTGKKESLLREGAALGNISVLIVDDDPAILEYVGDILGRMSVRYDTADSGETALTRIKENGAYDVYFVDWRMPGMDGIDFTRRMRSSKGDEKAVVIMISSAEWSSIERDARSAGVDKFLSKPVFPNAVARVLQDCMGTAKPDALAAEPAHFKGCRLLLAEDIELNREIVEALLEPTLIEIDAAENGAIALDMFQNAPARYDIIFMDMQMPEMDGLEATRRIRALPVPQAKTVPIIAMTANVFREDVENCLSAGMNDHLGKPLNFPDVIGKLHMYLRKKK
ncbi:MAG: response regulator [Clostridiales bacterium]|jgi:signal transduction histidine kinase/CheY-like chemotaxis protein|nr:response regulator [Clostridiales bacterium]